MGTTGVTRSDGELVAASRRGEHQAFGQLVARYQDLVCAISYSSTGDHVLSEDVAQETFIAAWRQLDGLREPGRLRWWLCGIARNLARKARKARRRDELVEPDERAVIADGNPFDEAARGQVERLVRDALERVPARYREVLVLYYRENQSIRDVADALATSEAAVMQRLSRGRRYLADSMTEVVERSLRGDRPRRDLVAAVLASIAVIAVAPHVDASTRPNAAKGSTMLKLALAASAAVAVGTTAYLVHSHRDHAADSATARASTVRPALHYGDVRRGIAHALALGPTAAPKQIKSRSIAESDLALLPADSEAVVGFNIAQLQHSALWQQYVAPELAHNEGLRAFAARCGFDPVASLGAVSLGLEGLGQGQSPTGTVVIHGLDKAKAMTCFDQHAVAAMQSEGVHVSVDSGIVMLASADGTQHGGFTFTDGATAVVVLGARAETRAGIEQVLAGEHSLKSSPQFADALQKINTDASLWMVLPDASPVVRGANSTLARYTMQTLGTMYLTFDVTDSLAIDAGVRLGSPTNVADAVSTMRSEIDAMDRRGALRQYFDQLDVYADGSDLIFSVTIAGDQLLPLGAAIAAKVAMTMSATSNGSASADTSD